MCILLAHSREGIQDTLKSRVTFILHNCKRASGLSNANIAQRQGNLLEIVTSN